MDTKRSLPPFAKIIIPIILGIIATPYINPNQYLIYTLAIVAYIGAYLIRNHQIQPLYTYTALFLTGISLTLIHTPEQRIPYGEKIMLALEIKEMPYTAAESRWARTTARVAYFRPIQTTDETLWYPTNEKIQLYIDTCYTLQRGDQVALKAYLNPIDTTASRYGALMQSRGIFSRAYLTPNNLVAALPDGQPTLLERLPDLQQWSVGRLRKLNLTAEQTNLLTTLTVGYRQTLSPILREAYSRVGASHVLAVSGLHVGFVFLIVNAFFAWLALFPRGHLIKNGVVILLLFLYGVMSGLSPSVVRAVLMFSAAQVALALSVHRNSYNIVLGVATLMLAVNPFYLYDVSFQLSFAAVLSILFLFPRLYRRQFTRNRLLDFLLSSTLLCVAAQVGTIPLVAYHFGNVPLISVLINPLVIVAAFAIVGCGLTWLLLPIGWLNGMFSVAIGWMINLLNGVVSWAASAPWVAITGLSLSAGVTCLCYLLLGLGAYGWVWYEKRDRRKLQI